MFWSFINSFVQQTFGEYDYIYNTHVVSSYAKINVTGFIHLNAHFCFKTFYYFKYYLFMF